MASGLDLSRSPHGASHLPPTGPCVTARIARPTPAILRAVRLAIIGLGLRFVGGHPLAGRETTGYGAADPALFRDRPWVVVPPDPPDREGQDRVLTLIEACGGRPVAMSAIDHDRAVAAISHLPLLVSAALVEMASGGSDWDVARTLAAGGWAGMTRLARGDPDMGAGILATNGDEIVARLGAL